jgi:hypothetical protein
LLLKLSVVSLPDLPSIKYSPKKVTGSDIDQLIGTYSLRYVYVIEIITPLFWCRYIDDADMKWRDTEENLDSSPH